MPETDFCDKPIHALAASLAAGEFSAVELVNGCLDRIRQKDGEIKAFLHIDSERVLAEAEAADRRRREGKAKSEFDGIPVGIKD